MNHIKGEIVMRTIAIVMLVLSGLCIENTTALAQQADACKECRAQQRACSSNYSAKTCKTEYDICMKSCRKK
jgi:hypothetical protein